MGGWSYRGIVAPESGTSWGEALVQYMIDTSMEYMNMY